jgi:arginine/lysine/histidine transport system ATP-binding protein
VIKASNISKSFINKLVLDGISIEITPGEIMVVEGPSGSGKTTLLRCLTLLDRPDKGKIEIDNNNWSFPIHKKITVIPPFPTVTVVFQQLFLWPHLTNRQNITLAAKNHNHDYQNKLNELIEYLDMKYFIDVFPNQSSLGQKQRVALARALILDPRYIFFDEITSALDVEQIKNIIELLLDMKQKGIGIFFITHNLHVADRIADKTFYLDKTKGILL